MAAPKSANDSSNRKNSKKSKKRTLEVSSSDSESDIAHKNTGKSIGVGKEKLTSATQQARDSPMTDAVEPAPASSKSQPIPKDAEDFSSIYLRKVTAELGDDLDKVREAKDFKSSSLAMLIHALKQGESIYSAEEKRRVVGTANS